MAGKVDHTNGRRELASWLQLGVMIVGVGTVIFTVGMREQSLSDLKDVTADLVQVTSENAGSLLVQQQQIKDIKRRIGDIERRTYGSP